MIKVYSDFDDFIETCKNILSMLPLDEISTSQLRKQFEENNHMIIIDDYHHCHYNDRCKDTVCSLKEECHNAYNIYLREKKLERICND